MERISLDQLIENAEKGRVSRKEHIGKILEGMLDMHLGMFIRIDTDGERLKPPVFDNIDRILEIFGLNNQMLFRDVVYQANIYLQSNSHWMREAGYQAAEQLQIIFLSIINLGSNAPNAWSKPSPSGGHLRRRPLGKWLSMSETTNGFRAQIQQDFLNLPLQDFLEYCWEDDPLPEDFLEYFWSEGEGFLEKLTTLRELLCIGAEYSAKEKKWIPRKLSLEQQKVLATVFFLGFRNLIPRDYVPPYLPTKTGQ